MSATTSARTTTSSVLQAQLISLDDTDCYATTWQQALEKASSSNTTTSANSLFVKWGGRGQGGRGAARRTFQPKDVVVDGVRLEYVGSSSSNEPQEGAVVGSASSTTTASRLLLEAPTVLKILSGHVYAAIGRNGSGKSTLLKRIHYKRIPGFPPHIRTLYIAQDNDQVGSMKTSTPLQYVLQQHDEHTQAISSTVRQELHELEAQLEALDVEEDPELVQELGEQISQLEDELMANSEEEDDETTAATPHQNSHSRVQSSVQEALTCMGVPSTLWNVPMSRLSPGIRQKTALATALVCECDLLLLDEPSRDLDVVGLMQLRRLIQACSKNDRLSGTTVLLVSHDLDLLNDVATDVMEFSQKQLFYYQGNYHDYLAYRQQNDLHSLRQAVAFEKKRSAMVQTLGHLKHQPVPKHGGAKKKGRQIQSHRKKMERLEISAGTGSAVSSHSGSSLNKSNSAVADGSTTISRGMTAQQLLQMKEKSMRLPPDKAVQFVFRNPSSTWGGSEPLIMAMDLGHGYPDDDAILLTTTPTTTGSEHTDSSPESNKNALFLQPKPGYLFDCVDLCIEEGQRYCILGNNMCGKSVLLRLLAKLEEPVEGYVKHATNVDVGMLDHNAIEEMMQTTLNNSDNSIAYLSKLFPTKTEKDIRGELTNFGLSPQQSSTNVRFLSGGERRRLCLAAIMLGDPQVLLLDQPTSDLDVESVEALVVGLSRWTGTVVMVTHDASFVRSLEQETRCFAIVNQRLYRVEGGIDTYLQAFAGK